MSTNEENVALIEEAEAPTEQVEQSSTIADKQHSLASFSGFRDQIIWDLLSHEQEAILKDKIKQLIPDQEKGQSGVEEIRTNLFDRVWEQRKYTNGNSLSSIIFVFVTKESNFNIAKQSKEFSCHPVFRTRKCIKDDDSLDCCMVFIDEAARVYQNWQSYLDNNVLPAGTMVVPRRGVYTFDSRGEVELEVYSTPANSTSRKILNVADTTTAVSGFAAASVPLAVACGVVVAAPVLATAAAVGLAAAGYSAIRSGLNLADRSKHDQSIGLGDRQARNSWLGVAGGVVGLGAAGATKTLATAAATGREISAITEIVVNGMNISSIVLSGAGVANGILDIVLKGVDGDVTLLDVVQLSASLVIFTHSVYNFQLASNIISDSRNRAIQSYRDGLSNRQRKVFDKMSKETIRLKGNSVGQMDIIRTANEIPSKQYLNDLYKINRQLNERNVRPSFGGAGEGVVLNNELPVDTQVLRSSVQHKQGPDVLAQVKAGIPSGHSEGTKLNFARLNLNTSNNVANLKVDDSIEPDISGIGSRIWVTGARVLSLSSIILANNVEIFLREFGQPLFENIVNCENFKDLLLSMAENFSEQVIRFILHLTNTFIETLLEDIHLILRTFISAESVLYRILLHILQTYAGPTVEFLNEKTPEILEAVSQYFMSLNPNSHPDLWKRCTDCNGFFAINLR